MDGRIRVLYVGRGADVGDRADRLDARRDAFSTRVTRSPADALDVLAEERVDCVVSEHDPDGVDGLDLLTEVRDVDPAVPFVLFARDGSEAVASEAIGAGVTDYVRHDANEECYERLAAACEDAADQYLAEQDVAMLNDLARNVYERITDAFFAVDRDWTVTYLNSEAEDLLDVRAEDVIGENLWDVLSDAVGTTFYTEYHRAIATQEAVTFTEYYPPLDSHFETRAFPSEDGLSVHFREVDPETDTPRDGAHLMELTNLLSYDLVDSIERAQDALETAKTNRAARTNGNAATDDDAPSNAGTEAVDGDAGTEAVDGDAGATDGDVEEALDEVEEALDRMDDLVNHSITLASNPQS